MQVQHRQIISMGTRLDLVVAGKEPGEVDLLMNRVQTECNRIEGMISHYRPDSQVSLRNNRVDPWLTKQGFYGSIATLLGFEAMMNHRIETWPEGLAI